MQHQPQNIGRAMEVSQQAPEDFLLLGSVHNSNSTCSATGRAQGRQETPWLTEMWGGKGKSWSWYKTGERLFYLTEYDIWEILSVHRKFREGKQIKAESTALWLEYPTGPQEALAQLSALLTAFLSTAEAQPSTWPISLPFSIKGVGLFPLCSQERIICCVLAKLLG